MKFRHLAIPAAVAALAISSLSPAHALTIDPIFDSSITGNANASSIEGAIDSAVGTLDGLYTNNVTINVDFSYNTAPSGNLLSTSQFYFGYSYASYTAALAADAAANPLNTTLATAVANLSKGNDANGAKGIAVAYGQALMLSQYGLTAPTNFGNASVNVNSTQPFAFSRPVNGSSYDLIGGLEHELDEVIGVGGAGSTLNSIANNPNCGFFCNSVGPTDLYRYSAAGTPSFTTSPSATAYLSVDGGVTQIVGFNQNSGGDFGDFTPECGMGNGGGQLIQNAFNCMGQDENYNTTSPEFLMSESIGWDGHTSTSVPEPGALAILSVAIGGIVLARRRPAGLTLA
jgi:hypothetical protein